MAIIDIGMTREEVMASLEPAPPGVYTLIYEGLLKDESSGSAMWPTKKGGRMVKARFRIVAPGLATAHGKSIIYNGVLGQFSFAELCAHVPLITGEGLDTEAALGMPIDNVLVDVREYTDPDSGKVTKSNEIKKW